MSNDRQVILVEILQGTRAMSGGCDCSNACPSAASCGTTVNYEDAVKEMAAELSHQFGDQVEVKYVDINKTGLENYPVMNRVLQMGYPYPITLINGEPKFAGGVMTAEVKLNIDELLKKA